MELFSHLWPHEDQYSMPHTLSLGNAISVLDVQYRWQQSPRALQACSGKGSYAFVTNSIV